MGPFANGLDPAIPSTTAADNEIAIAVASLTKRSVRRSELEILCRAAAPRAAEELGVKTPSPIAATLQAAPHLSVRRTT